MAWVVIVFCGVLDALLVGCNVFGLVVCLWSNALRVVFSDYFCFACGLCFIVVFAIAV